MKKSLALVIVAAWAGAAMAATEVVDGVTWSYSLANGEATVTQGTTPCVGEMTVPDTLGGCPVTAIGRSAFSSKNEISKMTLPATVKSIGSSAFFSCSALASINFPEGLTTIGSYAFDQCSALTAVSLPDTVTSLGSHAFYYCRAMTTLKLSTKLTSIPEMAFDYCSALTKIVIPPSVTSIGSYAFYYCYSATTLTLPEGVKTIDSQAFYGCRALKALKIPSTVTSVAESAFQSTPALKTIEVASGCTCVKVVDGCLVSAAGNALLAVPSGNEHVTIPEGIVSIPAYMFYEATSLKSVSIPEGVVTIGGACFIGCSRLVSIEFPESLESLAIGGNNSLSTSRYPGRKFNDFFYMSSLRYVKFNCDPPSGFEFAYFSCDEDIRIEYPHKYGAAWQKVVALAKFNGYKRTNEPEVEYVTVAVRANDPTILDVVYRVKSAKATVKVRALAFKDGLRSFANVVRPTEFIESTAANIGDAIAANVEHKLSWRVSADWKVDLAKCKFEVLAVENDLLPLELRTIPANGENKAMEISWNAITEAQVFDALLWLYAAGDEGLTLEDGVLRRVSDNYILAYGTTLSTLSGRYRKDVYGTGTSSYQYFAWGNEYVFSKMGYSVLSDDALTYANKMTRLGLSPSGVRQYAYRWIEEK